VEIGKIEQHYLSEEGKMQKVGQLYCQSVGGKEAENSVVDKMLSFIHDGVSHSNGNKSEKGCFSYPIGC
jgi:hypothetical protein